MVKKADKKLAREARHRRVREKISGTPERPRLNVFRSTKHIYAQLIDDVNGVTLASASSLSKDFDGNGGNKDGARKVGQMIAKSAIERVSQLLFSTEAVTFIMAVSKSLLNLLAKTDYSSNKEVKRFG